MDYLKAEYDGDDHIKDMQVLNLVLSEDERIGNNQRIVYRLVSIANRVRLLGSEFKDSRIVEHRGSIKNYFGGIIEFFEGSRTKKGYERIWN